MMAVSRFVLVSRAIFATVLAYRPSLVDAVRNSESVWRALRAGEQLSALELQRSDDSGGNESDSNVNATVEAQAEALFAEAAGYGLSRHHAAQMGVLWKANGLEYSQISGGVDTECDGGQFDPDDVIVAKTKFACDKHLAGMMTWRLDNDNLEKNGKCIPGSQKQDGNAPSYKGAKAVFDAVQKYCKERYDQGHFKITGYIGFGINDDINDDRWHARDNKPLYTALPYDKVNRVYLAFADIRECEVKPLPEYIHSLVKEAKQKNPDIEIYLTSSCNADQYKKSSGGWCGDAENSKAFVASIKKELQTFGLHGFDIDWESGIEKEAYMNILKELHSGFGGEYGLTMAVWPYFSNGEYDLDVIRKDVQMVSLMSYGGRGGDASALVGSAASFAGESPEQAAKITAEDSPKDEKPAGLVEQDAKESELEGSQVEDEDRVRPGSPELEDSFETVGLNTLAGFP
eukprot:TRINITY_DN20206_c0_g1_i1.p1 TRINITY_DN20206_c0_g1~~TRINITY_DN20206_c0_g1_i1.p1  ORF type:complete len:459 (-),score=124.06 TRINITY_DN20206_c0_g1_i1:62-1438(-)